MFSPPPTFVTLREAYDTLGSDNFYNIIAVVLHCYAPAKTAKDWTVALKLSDPSGYSDSGAPFRFFHSAEQRLPPFGSTCENGDVVVIRKMRVKDFGGIQGISHHSTEWAVINGHSLLSSVTDKLSEVAVTRSAGSKPGFPTTAELLYAKEIREATDSSKIEAPAQRTVLEIENTIAAAGGVAPKLKNKFSLIKDIEPPTGGNNVFKDLFGEVRRIYKTDSRMEIKVTDYTSNDMLFDYKLNHNEQTSDGDPFGYAPGASKNWPGPHGKRTILITLWDAHARFASRELCEGNYVLLKNVHLKMDRNGVCLEGHCRGDKLNTERVYITIVKPVEAASNEHLKELLKRKQAVEKAEGPKFARDPTNLKRRAEAMSLAQSETTVSGSTAKNKKKRQNKRRGNQKGIEITDGSDGREQDKRSEIGALFSANTQVRIMKVEVPCKPIYQILDLDILQRQTAQGNTFSFPFQNCRYKSQVRVVDFFPNNLADFAAPVRESDYEMLSDRDESDSEVDASQLDDHDVKWKWRFFLVVEDASCPPGQQPMRMELLVFDQEGDHLLNMEACNLRKNPKTLNRIKENLFTLWGDLQELKEEASGSQNGAEMKPSALPFECLIAEYGIQIRDEEGLRMNNAGFERVFHLWGTTIK